MLTILASVVNGVHSCFYHVCFIFLLFSSILTIHDAIQYAIQSRFCKKCCSSVFLSSLPLIILQSSMVPILAISINAAIKCGVNLCLYLEGCPFSLLSSMWSIHASIKYAISNIASIRFLSILAFVKCAVHFASIKRTSSLLSSTMYILVSVHKTVYSCFYPVC